MIEQLIEPITLLMLNLRKTAPKNVTIQHLVMNQNGKFLGQVKPVNCIQIRVLKMKDGNQTQLRFRLHVSTLKENLKNVSCVSLTFSSKF